MILLKIWISYAIWGAVFYSAVFLWAVRNRQFSDLDRQRYIALRTSDSLEETEPTEQMPSSIDRYTWLVLLVLAVVMVTVALWLALKSGGMR